MEGEGMADNSGDLWAVYARISYVRRKTAEGKTTVDTLGVDRQEPPCRDLVERKGGHVARVFVDNDRSAFKGERPDFETMLAWARDGRIKGIAAWDVDRLSRNPDRDNIRIIELAERFGVQLATVTGEYDLATSSGKMMFRIAGAVARRESEHRSERMLLKWDELAEAGVPKGVGKRPFGYARNGLDLDEGEAALLREALERLLDKKQPMHEVIGDWTARGVTAVMGGRFTTTSLRRALCSPRAAGLRQHRGEIVGPARWPAIFTTIERERLLAYFERPERRKQGPPRTYVYSGMLRCGRPGCGAVMVGASVGSGRPMYACKGGPRDPDHRGCGRTWISKGAFEEVMTEAVTLYVCGPKFAEVRARRLAAAAASDPTPGQIERDERELRELATLKGQGRFTIAEWLALRDPIDARIKAAKARLDAKPDLATLLDIPTVEADLRAAWARWTVEERRRALGAVLEHVVINPKGRGRRFDPDRIDPHWRP
jgi:site-specific DNA recombinase